MTDPNAPQNVPSDQPTSVPPSDPPAFVADGQQQSQQQPRYGEMHPDPVQQQWNQTGQQTPAPQQAGQWSQPQSGDQGGQWGQPQQGQYGQPNDPSAATQHTGQYGQETGQYGQDAGQYGQSQTGQYGQPQHTGQYGAPQAPYGQSQTGQYGQPQQQYAQAQPKAPNPRARETRLALISVGIAGGIAAAVALVGLIGSFFSISEYFPVGDVLLSFGANLVNIALWGAGAALILILVRPLTRVRTARDLVQSVGIAAAVGTGVMMLIVLIVTIVRGVVEQYGTATFIVNQGFLSPLLYGVTLAGFLTIGALLATRFVAPEGLADAPRGQHDQHQQGQHHQQQHGQPEHGQHQQGQQQPYGQQPQGPQQHNPYQQ
ncbi:hypothetical protein [Plantibacter sp. ME-Dv--P-095]|uniref:hypothetical protein n=1 Tax=Plantibacter sp. ME-Dv--P-095 TaxID=3040299 RepID=UPI002551986B|nr:hypothetical protein [Plantibacter sp. ME-Dv--P-095]